jgi:hypothetical protein
VRTELKELASKSVEQEEGRCIDRLVYPIIGVLKRHGVVRQDVTPELVVSVAEATLSAVLFCSLPTRRGPHDNGRRALVAPARAQEGSHDPSGSASPDTGGNPA